MAICDQRHANMSKQTTTMADLKPFDMKDLYVFVEALIM